MYLVTAALRALQPGPSLSSDDANTVVSRPSSLDRDRDGPYNRRRHRGHWDRLRLLVYLLPLPIALRLPVAWLLPVNLRLTIARLLCVHLLRLTIARLLCVHLLRLCVAGLLYIHLLLLCVLWNRLGRILSANCLLESRGGVRHGSTPV